MRELIRSNRGLVLLNALLLGAVVLVAFGRPAGAQSEQPASARARGEYTMVSGKIGTGGADAVYVLDAANQQIVAMRWDVAKQTLVGIGYRDIAADGKVLPGR